MMDPNVIMVPVFLGLIGAEYAVGRLQGKHLYRLGGLFDDIASSVTHVVGLAVIGLTTFTLYEWLRQGIAVWEYPSDTVWAWLIAWVVSDFCWYWRHRFGHDVSVGWAIHEVHHQSSDMNLAVGLRVGAFQWIQTLPFMVPMALLGMPMWMFATIFGVAHLYQTLLHTQLVDRVPLFGAVLTMPADHRLHHAKNPRYLDKNFGHNLIIWDRLFGTYAVEQANDPIEYGIDRPQAHWDPIRNNLEPWLELFGQRPAPSEPAVAATSVRHRVLGSVWFGAAMALSILLLQNGSDWPLWMRILAAVAAFWGFGQAGRALVGRTGPTAPQVATGLTLLVLVLV